MKKSVITMLVATTTAILLGSASVSWAQYGACEPACDVPQVEACAPTCAPTCETSYAPSCAPSCDVQCPTSYGGCYGANGVGCGSACGGLYAFVDDVARVATAPFHWVACAFTDGIYPDCGCAPRPPKTPCNPCNICGDYVGGCNDAGGCAPCAAGCPDGSYSYAQGQPVYSSQSVAAPQVYDVDSYDASPTRFSANARPVQSGSLSRALGDVMGTRRPVAPQQNAYANVQPNPIVAQRPGVRSVSYDQRVAQPQTVRPVATPAPAAPRATTNRELQNKRNVRIVSDANAAAAGSAAAGKTFGKTRPIK